MSIREKFHIPELFASYEDAKSLKTEAANLISWDLTPRQVCDLELLMNGGFYPLNGFMNKKDYDGVVENMRLVNGSLWPIPINLDVTTSFAKCLNNGQRIALRDQEGVILAILEIADIYEPNKNKEAEFVYGTNDISHPSVNYLYNKAGDIYLGGKITGIQPVVHYDFRAIRDTPNELRSFFQKVGWDRIVAFQTRNPLHRAHQELTFQAAKDAQANLLIHPVVGMGKPGDIDHFTRVRCYEAVIDQYPAATTSMSLLNLAMRMGGPREALWHGLIRKNHGCTHLIIGRDHAGPGLDSNGESFYGPYDAQKLFKEHEDEIGIKMIDFKHMVYVQERAQYEPFEEIKDKETVTILNISGTELRRRLSEGLDIPEWFSFPSVVKELRKSGSAKVATWEIDLADLVVTEVPKSGWMVASHDGESVALDLALTPALIEAGNVREVIRFIQERRKSDGFDISDRIKVRWNADQSVVSAIESAKAHISDEVLALEFERDAAILASDNELGIEVVLVKA